MNIFLAVPFLLIAMSLVYAFCKAPLIKNKGQECYKDCGGCMECFNNREEV